MKTTNILLSLAVPFVSINVHACPPGSILQKGNGWEGCVQISGPSPESTRRHKTQWGAIAIDGPNSAFGVSAQEDSKKRSENFALERCKADGGKNCKIKLAYYNQCASVISGDASIFVQSAETRDEAISDGLDRCRRAGDTGCSEHYSGCSLPKQVR
ncbi:DUF4189 domain-containing protein [Lysobacter enzymogenes]|uniref:DUF4189 domain-containing protein n=1 Tax=Lysobacter enzymogenes TaxID=69 RepID=UPI0037492A8B